MANKYHNEINEYDGNIFDSLKERQRYMELKLLERAGEIKELKIHPQYLLQAPFIYQDKAERAIYYAADFQYITTNGNHVIIEDVKGMRTDVYKLKRKLFLFECKQGIQIYSGDRVVFCHPEFYEVE